VTWVFGSATFLGSAVLVGDIQVTLPSGQTVDCLQKIYPLDQNVVGGFAGDVYAGFALLARLQSFLQAHDEPLPVESVFESFPRIAQDTFAQLDADHQSESALLVAGASVSDASLYGSRPNLARFTSPDFATEEIEINRWTAIGSGAEVEAYRGELEAAMSDEAKNLLTMESNNPGGFLNALTITIIMNVFDMPAVQGIAKHFHIGTVFASGCSLRNSDRELYPADGPPEAIRMPPVAKSWSELVAMLQPYTSSAVTAVRA
jgi:hypothetical protein